MTAQWDDLSDSVILSRMLLVNFRAMHRAYEAGGEQNIDKVFPEMLIGMAVLVKTYRKMAPCSASALSRMTGLPRSTVRRRSDRMVELGVLRKTDGEGYTFHESFITGRSDRRNLNRVRKAVLFAACVLQHL
ncbi:hypothetical protein ACVMGC_004745 [Bradyrhizobium barranii subsp. barranii]|uniref:helix-turn-helix domain-containing protein n=1 Tax=Bradyrhizobium liaoningense TaxID=43992 RepID=UPI001BAD6D95|nr:helix-turn-helix domain-containing protein [Bradyrhizobium liaoningense]MBR0879083.1 helix-turn-helix domain-containing protein [Bradyrhizobium liaoningense]